MCADRRPASVPSDEWAAGSVEPPLLSGRVAVLRSGQFLADIAQRLRTLEAVMIESEGAAAPADEHLRRARRARLQAMDLILQELVGLSDVLQQLADHAVDTPDPFVDALVDVPRLQSLSLALRAADDTDAQAVAARGIVLF